MPITKNQAATLAKKIARFTSAAIDDSWKGGGHPGAIPEIERELRVAELDLDNYINRLTEQK